MNIVTDYTDGGQWYVFPGEAVSFVCTHPGLGSADRDYVQIQRGVGAIPVTIFTFIEPNTEIPGSALSGRTVTSAYTSSSVTLTISAFDVAQDSQIYACSVCAKSGDCESSIGVDVSPYVLCKYMCDYILINVFIYLYLRCLDKQYSKMINV